MFDPAHTSKAALTEGGFLDSTFEQSRLSPLPVAIDFFPEGWMSPLELTVLYNLSRFCPGPILEIGSWVGRSTVALALGVRDSGTPHIFDVVDLGFVSRAEFGAFFGYPADAPYLAQEEIRRPLEAHGGVIGCLLDNLRARELLGHVTTVTRGNAASASLRTGYGVVFCDAVHSPQEIAVTGPVLARVLRPGAWVMCDDIDNNELLSELERHLVFEVKYLLKDFDTSSKAMFGRVSATIL